MIQDAQWRKLIYDLSEADKTCVLLQYAIQVRSRIAGDPSLYIAHNHRSVYPMLAISQRLPPSLRLRLSSPSLTESCTSTSPRQQSAIKTACVRSCPIWLRCAAKANTPTCTPKSCCTNSMQALALHTFVAFRRSSKPRRRMRAQSCCALSCSSPTCTNTPRCTLH